MGDFFVEGLHRTNPNADAVEKQGTLCFASP